MKRRDFLAMGAAMAGGFAARPVLAQGGGPATRAAVVIGVDKAGHLPVLSAAKSGARMMASWLQSEGFEVKLFLDENKAVRVGEIFDAIAELVDRGTLKQLVVYFSGHGFVSSYSELWMLSNAPDNPNEAISLLESGYLAKEVGIPNVVFISDACRSTADSLGATRVRGSLVFPNTAINQRVRPDVDKFLATLPGNPAYEIPVTTSAASFQGVYTATFLAAFQQPDTTMVQTVDGKLVVPNNKLKPYLEREVQKRAEAKSITLRQMPDTDVVSPDTTYIGRVSVATSPSAPDANPRPQATLLDAIRSQLKLAGANVLSSDPKPPNAASTAQFTLEAGLDLVQTGVGFLGPNIPDTGFIVIGAPLAPAETNPKVRAKVVPLLGLASLASVRVDLAGQKAGSVGLRFADGSGTVVCALAGFVGAVVVKRGGIVNVTYTPSPNNDRWSGFQQVKERLLRLHAAVAVAARFGIFRIEGERNERTKRAEDFGDTIRILKGIDPTLGLYAAYAYAEADLVEKVRSVRSYMHDDLQADLFDVALLSGALSGTSAPDIERVFPFCPMLSQGWGLLRVKNVRLPPLLAEARDHLLPALWTTFDRQGMEIISGALKEGRLR
jgi:hypothetical protein